MKGQNVSIQRLLCFVVGWLCNAVGTRKSDLLKVDSNLFDDGVVVVGYQRLVAVYVKVVEPSVLGL